MTAPISERRGIYTERNPIVATILGEAHKLAVERAMPAEFNSRLLSPEPEAVDDLLFKKVREIVLQDQMTEFANQSRDQLSLPDFLHYKEHTIGSLIKGWDTLFPEGAGHQGLKWVPDDKLRQLPRINAFSINKTRTLYPYAPQAVEQRPEPKESIRLYLGGMTRKAREDGYPGVATLLTLAWVVAEQHDSEPVGSDLIKRVQKDIVQGQLRGLGFAEGLINKLLRSDIILSDATDLSLLPDDQIPLGRGSLAAIREKYPFQQQ